jgi:hypothetical protein
MITIPSLRAQPSTNRSISKHQRGSNRPCALSSAHQLQETVVEEKDRMSQWNVACRIGRNVMMGAVSLLLPSSSSWVACAQRTPALEPAPAVPGVYGPFSATSLADGAGLRKQFAANDAVPSSAHWTLTCWVQPSVERSGKLLIAGVGDPAAESAFLGIDAGVPFLRIGGKDLAAPTTAKIGVEEWHLLTATFDGTTAKLFRDGVLVAHAAGGEGHIRGAVLIAPVVSATPDAPHFGGEIADLTLSTAALTDEQVSALFANRPNFDLINFEEAAKSWPVQTRGQAGYRAPQAEWTLPHSAAPFSTPVAKPVPPDHANITADGADHWVIDSTWKLAAATDVHASAPAIADAAFAATGWYTATVPGTVLTTLVDRGVYPDPDYGLNNMAIPESLNKHKYWYRSEFVAPQSPGKNHRWTLTFNGINYVAEVWLNGQELGTIKGAFIRGTFDVSKYLRPGETNTLAVLISPPPHPGIPQEQSIAAGPGENGGLMCLDGPTFVATEGWDWIPAIRDRNMGIWQDVELTATGTVEIGDPHVVTRLPLPDNSEADVEIDVPLKNDTSAALPGTVTAAFDDVSISKQVEVPPGGTVVKLTPAEFPQLKVEHPRLWWPNGYGKPNLHNLALHFNADDASSDHKELRFGMREITYDLSLLDHQGLLRRVGYSPEEASDSKAVVDVSHTGMRESTVGYVSSFAPGGESSPAIHPADSESVAPYLLIRVNGVRIAARGGNWGMDDSRKRVSRARLEPYFRLHRDAHLNIIRNWVGQDTEQTFFDLADEYGMMVWSDFWDSTENYNIEPQDPALFLKNAADVIARFRNHPSIVLWCGRNEGVPQPILNEGLDELIRTLDGTRFYSPSSNQVNLQNSGPYRYEKPDDYFTTFNRGFSVEVGTPSMPTVESMKSSLPKADQWPISDAWAYHDWHQAGNGDVKPFMDEIAREFGPATSLDDFERKAQMLNFVDHRAIFEGMNAHLWAPNSGRMLWMTQPAWPSTMWQILGSNYDTQASFFGVMHAAEPVHVQFDHSTHTVQVVNTTDVASGAVELTVKAFTATNKLLFRKETSLTLGANRVETGLVLDPASLPTDQLLFLKLEVRAADRSLLSENLYWLPSASDTEHSLSQLPAAQVKGTATEAMVDGETQITVHLTNDGTVAALQSKLTLEERATGALILPAYYSDNYVSLLPGESRDVTVRLPEGTTGAPAKLLLAGWNVPPVTIEIQP